MEMTITGKGQFTLNKGLMEHLGIRSGEAVKNKLSLDEMLQNIDKIMGGRDIPSSLDDIGNAIMEGYANAGMWGA